jgi:hypothetical protein
MDAGLKDDFLVRWEKYLKGADLPMVFYYSDDISGIQRAKTATGWRCVIADIMPVQKGKALAFDIDSLGCGGAQRYFGFTDTLRPNFEYFLSCGIPGEMEGERYKKTPEMVLEGLKHFPAFTAPARYIIFKRWDHVAEGDEPVAVIFFAPPDVLSGLFTLANFDTAVSQGVVCPFASGCGSIVHHPYIESQTDEPRAVMGMFDVSARPYVPRELLTFSVPMKKFKTMVENMDESFLITDSWKKVKKRIR